MSKYLKIGSLVFILWWAQSAFAQDTIPVNTTHAFQVTYQPGYIYSWWYINSGGDTTYFSSNSNITEEVFWETEGDYQLFAQASDLNACLSEIISKPFHVIYEPPADLVISAGRDTAVGICNSYQLNAEVDVKEGITYTYLWEPSNNLNDPNIANPVFTPGNTTTFILKVSDDNGNTAVDSVKITVSEIMAEAGDDVLMVQGSTTLLDGSASVGTELQYQWVTIDGKIESGENTPGPVVSGFGEYYMEVTDAFGCVSTDSVNVSRMEFAPIANDDYSNTRYLTEVKIPVLDNDTDMQNSIVPSTLTITLSPVNGTAYVDFDEFVVHYRPNEGFSGTDQFEYQICNTYDKCDQANVYILVSDFNFLIPNAFSPNGDGINDYFEILGIDYYDGNSLTIINRWGNKVFETKNYGISSTPKFWDGKANTGARIGNEELPTGTYYYILDLGNGEKSIGGSIYLDR